MTIRPTPQAILLSKTGEIVIEYGSLMGGTWNKLGQLTYRPPLDWTKRLLNDTIRERVTKELVALNVSFTELFFYLHFTLRKKTMLVSTTEVYVPADVWSLNPDRDQLDGRNLDHGLDESGLIMLWVPLYHTRWNKMEMENAFGFEKNNSGLKE